MMGQIKAKTFFAVVVGLYFLKCAYDPSQWHFLDGVNLIIHEARHVAQISVLLRTQGIAPPFLDLLNYLPVPSA